MGTLTISDPGDRDAPGEPLLALLYADGDRPAAAAIARIAAASGEFAVVFEPPAQEGWLEALITGLSFELAGLTPGVAGLVPEIAHRFGFDEEPDWKRFEPVFLRPGPHLVGGENMLPVVRASLALADAVARGSGAQAVAWAPSRTAMSPAFFAEMTRDWLAGGPFPALGLAALTFAEDGIVASEGLGFFIGQEVAIRPAAGDSREDIAKLAVRLIDRMIEAGAIGKPTRLTGPAGEALLATPSADGTILSVVPAE